MITITDAQGNAISWSSAGMMGFKGSRKSTPYAAQVAADDAGKKAAEHGVRTLEVEVKGPGSGRESALRGLAAVGFNIHQHRRLMITGISHVFHCIGIKIPPEINFICACHPNAFFYQSIHNPKNNRIVHGA